MMDILEGQLAGYEPFTERGAGSEAGPAHGEVSPRFEVAARNANRDGTFEM